MEQLLAPQECGCSSTSQVVVSTRLSIFVAQLGVHCSHRPPLGRRNGGGVVPRCRRGFTESGGLPNNETRVPSILGSLFVNPRNARLIKREVKSMALRHVLDE